MDNPLRTWSKIGDYRWVCPPWQITIYTVCGRPMYALWKDDENAAIGYDRDMNVLMEKAREIEKKAGVV